MFARKYTNIARRRTSSQKNSENETKLDEIEARLGTYFRSQSTVCYQSALPVELSAVCKQKSVPYMVHVASSVSTSEMHGIVGRA